MEAKLRNVVNMVKECLKDLLEQREEEIEFENDKDEYCPYKIIYKKDFR